MDLKPPKTFLEQVKQLQKHNMQIEDQDAAIRFLSRVNYYRFTGYALHCRVSQNNSDFKDGTSFKEIERLYSYDESLRNILRKYIEKIEIYYRTQIAYHFSINNCQEAPHDQHYEFNKYYERPDRVMEIFQKFNSNANEYYGDSLIISHHRSHYDNHYPLWVIVEMLSLSDLSKYYNSMYASDKECIAKSAGIPATKMASYLHCMSVLRNKCAHAARLYNTDYHPKVQFPKKFKKKRPEIMDHSLFSYLWVLIKCLPSKTDKQNCAAEIIQLTMNSIKQSELSIIGFPLDYIDLFIQTTNV